MSRSTSTDQVSVRSCVRTISSKTQGARDGCLEDKPELQLSLVSHERHFTLLGYQQEILEATGMLLNHGHFVGRRWNLLILH